MSSKNTRRILAGIATLAALALISSAAPATAQPLEQAPPIDSIPIPDATPPIQHDWALMEQCWPDGGAADGCPGTLTLRCHWQAGYPSRVWIERACGPISAWTDRTGTGWSNGTTPEARAWIDHIRAGGNP